MGMCRGAAVPAAQRSDVPCLHVDDVTKPSGARARGRATVTTRYQLGPSGHTAPGDG